MSKIDDVIALFEKKAKALTGDGFFDSSYFDHDEKIFCLRLTTYLNKFSFLRRNSGIEGTQVCHIIDICKQMDLKYDISHGQIIVIIPIDRHKVVELCIPACDVVMLDHTPFKKTDRNDSSTLRKSNLLDLSKMVIYLHIIVYNIEADNIKYIKSLDPNHLLKEIEEILFRFYTIVRFKDKKHNKIRHKALTPTLPELEVILLGFTDINPQNWSLTYEKLTFREFACTVVTKDEETKLNIFTKLQEYDVSCFFKESNRRRKSRKYIEGYSLHIKVSEKNLIDRNTPFTFLFPKKKTM